MRSRFARRHAEPEALDAPDIMAMVDAATPPDRAGAFELLAPRERLAQAVEHLGARGWQDLSAPAF